MTSEMDLPHCTQCLRSFKYRGPDPYLLSCLHSVCESCLCSDREDVVSCKLCQECFTKTDNNFPAYCHTCLSNPDPCFCCTDCLKKKETETCFPKDHVTIRKVFIITAKENASELLCTNRNDGNQALSWCQECEAFLCEHCQVSHEDMKATRYHDVTSVQDLANSESRSQAPGYCSLHKGHPLEHYDQDCYTLICYKCSQNEHKHCNVCDLEAGIHEIKEDTDRSIRVLTGKIDEIDQLQQCVQEIDQRLDETKMTLIDSVQHSFSEMKTVLGQREEEVKLQLDQCLQNVKRQNIDIVKTLKTDKERHETALHISKGLLGVSTPDDLFRLKRFIGNRTLRLASTELPLVRNKVSSMKFLAQDLQEIKRAISSHGTFCTTYREMPSRHAEDGVSREAAEETGNITITYSPNVTSAVFTGVREAFTVKFLEVEFDVYRANTGKVEFTSDMALSRKLQTTQQPDSSGRFVNFNGTTSLQPVSSSDIQYWEVNAHIEMLKELQGVNLLFEVGIAVESSIDVGLKLSGQPDSMILYLRHCKTHHSLCLRIRGLCLHQPLPNAEGERKMLQYGVMTNPKERKYILFDLNRTAILHTFTEVNFSQRLWPTFAVFNRSFCKTELRCISGGQIQLNRVKLDLLHSCFK
ncbi:E3 ubiquitin-protein ligase TRIM45-like [Haliotis asinina]|uniref:E3 ubiquitin-protein ligase TRIM45-like n=1 Tax=Haliotis asinina TaxID=109174 RepID=UPI0035318BD3